MKEKNQIIISQITKLETQKLKWLMFNFDMGTDMGMYVFVADLILSVTLKEGHVHRIYK